VSRCPKCQGLTYANGNTHSCAVCGLHHEVGANTESLKRQILGDLYVNPIKAV
jgi:hypothetical protein